MPKGLPTEHVPHSKQFLHPITKEELHSAFFFSDLQRYQEFPLPVIKPFSSRFVRSHLALSVCPLQCRWEYTPKVFCFWSTKCDFLEDTAQVCSAAHVSRWGSIGTSHLVPGSYWRCAGPPPRQVLAVDEARLGDIHHAALVLQGEIPNHVPRDPPGPHCRCLLGKIRRPTRPALRAGAHANGRISSHSRVCAVFTHAAQGQTWPHRLRGRVGQR